MFHRHAWEPRNVSHLVRYHSAILGGADTQLETPVTLLLEMCTVCVKRRTRTYTGTWELSDFVQGM